MTPGEKLRIAVPGNGEVSALLVRPPSARWLLVSGHGASVPREARKRIGGNGCCDAAVSVSLHRGTKPRPRQTGSADGCRCCCGRAGCGNDTRVAAAGGRKIHGGTDDVASRGG